jgi:hypothetical protein
MDVISMGRGGSGVRDELGDGSLHGNVRCPEAE